MTMTKQQEKARLEAMKAIGALTENDKMAERAIKGYIELLETELEHSRLTHAGLAEITQTTYDEIWAIVGDGKGEWDYPAQIVRFTEYLKQDRDIQFKHKVEFANKLNDLALEVEMNKSQKK